IESGNLRAASQTIDEAIAKKTLEALDPRVQRLSEQLKTSESQVTNPAPDMAIGFAVGGPLKYPESSRATTTNAPSVEKASTPSALTSPESLQGEGTNTAVQPTVLSGTSGVLIQPPVSPSVHVP